MTAPVPPFVASALTLSERLAVFREHGHLLGEAELELSQGRRWVDKLKAMPPFDQLPHLWERFLTAHQLTEDELLRALSAPAAFLAAHAPTASRWDMELEEALAEGPRDKARPITWPPSMGPQAKLILFSRPLITWALKRIRRGRAALEASSGQPLVAPDREDSLWLTPLANSAFQITHRALVLELNIARLRKTLTGETPAERFEAFVTRLEEPTHARAIYEEYAVLSRQVLESLRTVSDFFLLFLRHLAEDRSVLRETFFGGEDPGLLDKVSMSGDSHRGGKRVLILEFSSGRKLLYKPHSLRVDEHFQGLLRWLNEHGAQPPLRTMNVLDRGEHGWTEFIETAGCTEEAQLRRFYLRQGSLLAVLYGMLATDIHYENLIASGEHPVLIDLESLFHPGLRPVGASQLQEALLNTMTYSVLRTALLPTQRLVGKSDVLVDVGGLSDVEGQESPFASPYVNMSVADEAHIDRMKMRMGGGKNVPTLNGARPDPAAYTEDIVEGFKRMYGLLLTHREALLAPDGPMRRFAGDSIRFIFRHTRIYGVLARETLHPDLQRHALERERHFLRLWALLEQRQDVAGLISSEVRALWKGDIPFFHTRTDSVDLFDAEDQRHPQLLSRSCLEEVVEHLRRLDETDLKRQVWFIRGSMACLLLQSGHEEAGTTGKSYQPVSDGERTVSRNLYLQEARRVGDRIVELALRGRGDEGASWIGMALLREKIWQFLPLGIDLYNGLAGIALFLAYLARASGERAYEELARETLTAIRKAQQANEKRIVINGAFTGWGGLLYLYTHLYGLWREPRLLEEALYCARQMRLRAETDQDFEILYGNAGGLLALDSLYAVHPDPEVLEAMQACGQRIVSQGRPMAQGLGWYSKALGTGPLAGYSHGASGIAQALEVLYRRTGDKAYLEAATSALAYERTLFSPEKGNWQDMRPYRVDRKEDEPVPEPKYPIAWCNGAPGVGLSRLRMPSLEDATSRTELEAALSTTRQWGFGYTHCLCHGDLGNLELLLEARERPGLVREGEVERFSAGILEGIRQHGWVCGTPRGVETPGLMNGLAGIGYGFLRLYDPAGTPSVLLLDPPRSKTS